MRIQARPAGVADEDARRSGAAHSGRAQVLAGAAEVFFSGEAPAAGRGDIVRQAGVHAHPGLRRAALRDRAGVALGAAGQGNAARRGRVPRRVARLALRRAHGVLPPRLRLADLPTYAADLATCLGRAADIADAAQQPVATRALDAGAADLAVRAGRAQAVFVTRKPGVAAREAGVRVRLGAAATPVGAELAGDALVIITAQQVLAAQVGDAGIALRARAVERARRAGLAVAATRVVADLRVARQSVGVYTRVLTRLGVLGCGVPRRGVRERGVGPRGIHGLGSPTRAVTAGAEGRGAEGERKEMSGAIHGQPLVIAEQNRCSRHRGPRP